MIQSINMEVEQPHFPISSRNTKPFTMKLTKSIIIFVSLLLLSVELCSGTTPKCNSAAREALLAVKKSLSDPSGRLSSWAGEECCSWEGIECNNRSGHVLKVDLRNPFESSNGNDQTTAYKNSCLGGSLSPSLLALKDLTYLDLSMNNFDGSSIPDFLGGLANLRYLNLSYSSFSGVVPISLGNLARLQVLDLYADSYLGISSGELRAESLDWLSGLSSSLTHLNLGHVKLQKVGEAWLEKVNLLPLLLELNLNWCELQGLPISVPAIKFTSLRVLDLSENSFNSKIPQWLFSLTKLRVLHLTWNFFHGLIPKEIANLKVLEDLDLSSNLSLEGPIPRVLGSLARLKRLALSGNGFTGGIDEFLDGISTSKLESLSLYSNSLSGSLPESLRRLKSLQRLSLSGNSFSGSLPSSIGDLSSLKFLDVSDNSMNGTIPESFGQLSELADANLVMNSWEGSLTESQLINLKSLQTLRITTEPTRTLVINVPDKWVPPFRLDQIQLENVKLGPSFPMWLQVQTKLTSATLKNVGISGRIPDQWIPSLSSRIQHLDLSQNQIKGKLRSGLAFPKLSSIDLSSNRFNGAFPLWTTDATELFLNDNSLSGPVPEDLARLMPRLKKLYLARNRLSGKIPSSLCDLENVNIISLRGNKLSGSIPSCWKNKYTLWGFDVSDNNLSGAIPSAMGSLRTLAVLMMSNNNLSGEIPSSLQSCSGLTTLDLSGNKLAGSVPRWISGGSLASLFRLKLDSNEFSGHIPSELCSLSNLHSLGLSGNRLSGAIPNCLNNLSALASTRSASTFLGQLYIVLRGREPEYSRIVADAESIDLSGNNLAGKIPEQITALSALSRLDLSRNQIGGEIPNKIGNMSLETLDLSHNKLYGSIPASLSGMALLKHLNLSYNSLRGKIPALPRFNDASIFEGNPLLCGAPLATKCKTL